MSHTSSSGLSKEPIHPTLISIQGITASGKSDLALQIAKKLTQLDSSVWIVNADSRQVYKEMDVGTAKIPGNWETKNGLKAFYYKDIPHFLIDYIQPEIDFGIVDYINDFESLVTSDLANTGKNIKGDKIPNYIILVGGSGLYAKAIISGESPNQIKPDFKGAFSEMKTELQNLATFELQQKFMSAGFDKTIINDSDWQNPRRLVNKLLKHESESQGWIASDSMRTELFSRVINVGIQADVNDPVWISKLKYRVGNWTRLNSDLESEVKKLKYLGEEKIQQLGFEYSLTLDFLNRKLNRKIWTENLLIANRKYAKKQKTWLKKQEGIIWVHNFEEVMTTILKK